MSIITLASEEMKSGLKWMRAFLFFLILWIFRIFIRFVFLALLIFLAAGALIKTYFASKTKEPVRNFHPDSQIMSFEQNKALPIYETKERDDLTKKLRNGVSEARSWDYTLRSVKSDIERWFKK